MRRLLLCSVLAVSGPALAQGPAATATTAPKVEGEYGGVQPGEPREPGKRPKKPPPKGALSWIGFETKDGGSQIFLQSVAPFEVTQRIDKGTLVVTLTGLKRLAGNTWRFIDTRFFNTPIARVDAKRKGRGIEVRVTFKNPKDATQGSVRTATEADGMYYVYLSFAGTGTPIETSSPTIKDPEK